MPPTGLALLTIAFGFYVGVILIGFRSYFPREFRATKTRAILDDLDRENELLMEWTTTKVVELCEGNWRIGSEKGYWVKVTMVLFLIGTILLSVSLLVH
jgi:hypothetical protein